MTSPTERDDDPGTTPVPAPQATAPDSVAVAVVGLATEAEVSETRTDRTFGF
ncbi:hypothetical protein [Streptomyces antnestii]|uniref:hypothetical protein n=1 Tax=Streptomyces antnestii TaxID=2494256 RepID=UPI00167A2F59|nr:hypothetical protein [Streptomyces sp. San01]